jgi:hypothetical protein
MLDSSDALDRFRCTAALLSYTPTISARLVNDDRVLLEVMRPPHPVRDHAVIPTCWFRAMVADVTRNGPPVGERGREPFERLLGCRVELGVRHGTTLLPANVLRVEAGGSWMHLLALASPLDAVRTAAVTVAQEGQPDEHAGTGLDLHIDPDLETTVVGLASELTAERSGEAAELLRTIGMRLAIDRLEIELASVAAHPAPRPPRRRLPRR